jgi:NAD+ kinase
MPARIIGIVAHPGKPGASELVVNLHRALSARGIEVCLEQETAAMAGMATGLSTHDLASKCELLVALGGDGTLLRLVHTIGSRSIPIFGINLGSLGFLTCLNSSAWEQAVDNIANETYQLSFRSLLEVEVKTQSGEIQKRFGLNDAVISRGELSRLIKLEVSLDGKLLTEYSADGLIIATPTGSTAYSLSSGGPIIAPDAGVFVITPICPHVLTNRSVVISHDSRIDVVSATDSAPVFLTVDGQDLIPLSPGDAVTLRKAPVELPLATAAGSTFFDVLSQKLKWSGSAV